jgi:hypothetical protein
VTASWAQLIVAAVMCAGAVGGLLYRDGKRDGKIDAILEELRRIAVDHETRLRQVEPVSHRRDNTRRRGLDH